MTISEWADRKRILGKDESPNDGPWSTETVPFLRDIMNSLNDERIHKVIFMKCTQIGGTEVGINMLGYLMDQEPCRIIYVMPEDTTAKEFSSERLQKVFFNNACFENKYLAHDSKDTMLKFRGGFIKMASAQSPSALGSWPAPKVVLDEIDKYPTSAGKESSPIKLAEERTKNWHNKKIYLISTPTYKHGNIYQEYINADVRYVYQVPCPECGEYQALIWKQVKFDSKADRPTVEGNTSYECMYCKYQIKDRHKMTMLRSGKWVAENIILGNARSIGYRISTLYSPFVTFGRCAIEFLESKSDPKKLMNFINSWLGEPWESKAAKLDSAKILENKTTLPANIVPSWTRLITGGVDVQQGYFYWTIRAWGVNMHSQNIAYGRAQTFDEVQEIMDTYLADETTGELKHQVRLYGVDTGYDTENAYEFCIKNQGIAIPCKGSSTQMVARYRISHITPSKNSNKWLPQLLLYTVDTDQYKDMIAARINRKGDGAWLVHADTDQEYADQITAEHKIITEKNKRTVESWVKKTSAKQNHWLDCEVLSAVCADILNVRFLSDEPTTIKQEKQNNYEDESGLDIPDPDFDI